MQSPPSRTSVLGKRSHTREDSSCEQLLTPDPTPKRAKTSSTEFDGDHNKENVPPINVESIISSSSVSPRAARAIRRATIEATVTPPRPSARRRSESLSPAASIAQLTIITPPSTPPSVPQPLHVRARALLRAACDNNSEMPGRDSERHCITNFISDFLDGDETDCCALYISGSPGTGKTALVNSIIQDLDLKTRTARVVFINCMALKGVDALWERLVEELGTPRASKSKGRKPKPNDTIETVLAGLSVKCIVVLDELDHITPTSQTLSSLLSIPNSNPSVLRVIGIANTHTLTSSTSTLSTSYNVRTLHFAPYAPNQLLQILQTRLAPLCAGSEATEAKAFLSTPALTLLCKKIAALSGDVRSLLEVLRGAIDMVVALMSQLGETKTPPLTPSHILAALKAHTLSAPTNSRNCNSETVTKVQTLGLQARLVLLSLIIASRRIEAGLPLSSSSSIVPSPVKRRNTTSVLEINDGVEMTHLYAYYDAVLTRAGSGVFSSVSRSEFGDLINMLEGVGLVSVSSTLTATSSPTKGTKRLLGRSASFGCGANKGCSSPEVRIAQGVLFDEVLRGLGASAATSPSADIQAEEIRSLWERENARIGRDVKAAQAKAAKADGAVFQDATEG